MANNTRDIKQGYRSCDALPQLMIRTTYNSSKSYKAHSHASLSLGIIEAGQTCLSVRNRHIILNPGEMVLIPPHLVHACNPVQHLPRSYHMLYIDQQWCRDVLAEVHQQKVTHFTCETEPLSFIGKISSLPDVIRTLIKKEGSGDISQADAMLRFIVQSYCFPSPDNKNDSTAFRVRDWLQEQIEDPPSIDEIAQQEMMTQESVIRSFKRSFGITPRAFLNNCRVEKAKSLLRGGMNIADVALEVGYSDQSQLHKAFVSYTASTPGQYQNICSPDRRSISDNN